MNLVHIGYNNGATQMKILSLQLTHDKLNIKSKRGARLSETPIADDHRVVAHIIRFSETEYVIHRKHWYPWEHILPYVVEVLLGNDTQLQISFAGVPPFFYEDLRSEVGITPS